MPQTKPMRRFIALVFPFLATDRIARVKWGMSWRSDAPADRPPLASVGMHKSAMRILAADRAALKGGVFVGQTLSDARAICPSLDAVNADPAADEELLAGIAAWCLRYTPMVALTKGGLFLDITGCAHLFGGEEGLLGDLTRRLASQGFTLRAAIADTQKAAKAVALAGTGRGAEQIIAPGAQRQALHDLALTALELDPAILEGLDQAGLKTIGAVADLPRAPLANRFGHTLFAQLDAALGEKSEALCPLMPAAALSVEKNHAEPIALEHDIKGSIALLAQRLAALLEARELGVRQCRLGLFRVDGVLSQLEVAAARPLRDPQRLAKLFDERLAGLHEALDAGFGFDMVRLEATLTEPLAASQQDMVSPRAHADDYYALVERYDARLGSEQVRRFTLNESHLPERSFALSPFVQSAQNGGVALALEQEPETRPHPAPTRPLLLFAHPEPIEAIAQIPHGSPLKFRWRRVLYQTVRAEGPERIAGEWWLDGRSAFSRDYFRVETAEGYRFWLFRHGLYERETVDPRWYVHGVFA